MGRRTEGKGFKVDLSIKGAPSKYHGNIIHGDWCRGSTEI